jgi:hypothetical protein
MSERRACRVIGADRKSMRYRSQRDDDAGLRLKLRELAQQRRRFGYRRLRILLRREGDRRQHDLRLQLEALEPRVEVVPPQGIGMDAALPGLADMCSTHDFLPRESRTCRS